MASDLHFEVSYPHPPAKVWRALTEPEVLAVWLLPSDFAARVGHHFTFRTPPRQGFDGVIHGEVIECTPPHRLGFRWKAMGLETRVHWTLVAGPAAGTLVSVDHTGFTGMKGLVARPLVERGWARVILPVRLRGVLDAMDESGRVAEGLIFPPLPFR